MFRDDEDICFVRPEIVPIYGIRPNSGAQLILQANEVVEVASTPRGELEDELEHGKSAMSVAG